jgi:hypothetical protein
VRHFFAKKLTFSFLKKNCAAWLAAPVAFVPFFPKNGPLFGKGVPRSHGFAYFLIHTGPKASTDTDCSPC